MEHICYHILSDQNTMHIPNYEKVKNLTEEWKLKGDSNIRVFKIIATDTGSDEISIDESVIQVDEISNS